MANGEFVTWNEYNKHLDDTKEGYSRLEKVEAELMGDVETGRPSLRKELGMCVDTTNTILKSIGIPILVLVLAKIIIDWYVIQPSLAQLKTLENWKAQQEEIQREQLRWKGDKN